MLRVFGIVLAAGPSRRMGRAKMLLPVGGRTLLARAVLPLLDAGVPRVLVVLGAEADRIRSDAGLPADPRLAYAVNADWASGLASSLRTGLLAGGDEEAALVSLGDEPGVDTELVGRVLAAAPGRALVVPVHAGRAGHPILFGRALWPELLALQGDVGAREVVRRHFGEAATVVGVPPRDIDTPDDYESFLAGAGAPGGEGLEV